MDKPLRIRLRRAKGWKMPQNTVKADRTTPLGNPFKVGIDGTRAECVEWHKVLLSGHYVLTCKATIDEQQAHNQAVKAALKTLRGKNLACWCGLCPEHAAGKPFGVECGECAPCHADILGIIANG